MLTHAVSVRAWRGAGAVGGVGGLAAIVLAISGLAAGMPLASPQSTGSPEVVHHVADRPEPPAPEAPSRLQLTTERVAAFKNGYALVVKRATAIADARGRVFTEEVPDAAVLGCFWATTESGQIAAMRAELVRTERDESRQAVCLTLAEILRANKGARVTLNMRSDAPAGETTITGTVRELLESPPKPPDADAPSPAAFGAFGPRPTPSSSPTPADEPGTHRVPLVSSGGQLVAIDTDDGQRIVAVSDIRSIGGQSLSLRTDRAERVRSVTKRLSFDLGPAAAGSPQTLRIMYFTPGFRWIPTYRLSLNDDNRSGVLALQGELLNELEDFKGAALDMVVGVPNFRFGQTVSPLSLERTLRDALASAAPGLMGNQYSNALFAQRANEWREPDTTGPVAGADLAPELSAGGEQDLFVYAAPALDLNKGDRAAVPVLTQQVTFDHLYTLDIAAVRDPRESGSARYTCPSPAGPTPLPPLPPAGESAAAGADTTRVWHQIEIKNASSGPWTTGAAVVLSDADGRTIPVAQELLKYTPAGATALLPLTLAVDIKSALAEEEISRQENALRRNHTTYTLVRARSTITLTSSRNQASAMRVTLGLGGKVVEASDDARVVITGHHSPDWGNNDPGPVNNHSLATWRVDLDPGQTRTLTVEYTYYTPF